MMLVKQVLTIFIIQILVVTAGCATQTEQQTDALDVGPELSSSYEEADNEVPLQPAGPRLDVIIPVFDPGLSESAEKYEEEGIWPELRKAEANRFAYKTKQALDDTGRFGAVRVTPDKTASGDLYVLGTIKNSNGLEVEIAVDVVDIRGETWLSETYENETSEGFYKSFRNEGKDPYDPVFKKAADDITELLDDRSVANLENLKNVAELRFGSNFTKEAFSRHMKMEDGKISLVSMPSANDPQLERVKALRVREQLFIDNLQSNYSSFSENMNESYLVWQESSFTETQLQREAQKKSRLEAIGGALLLGLAVAAGISSESSLATTGAIAGGIAGATLISNSFQTSKEAKVHRDALNELGQSIDLELGPQVVEFENETVELTGDAKEQFAQWRSFMKKIYAQEATPDTQL